FESPKLHVLAAQRHISIIEMIFDLLHAGKRTTLWTWLSSVETLAGQNSPASAARGASCAASRSRGASRVSPDAPASLLRQRGPPRQTSESYRYDISNIYLFGGAVAAVLPRSDRPVMGCVFAPPLRSGGTAGSGSPGLQERSAATGGIMPATRSDDLRLTGWRQRGYADPGCTGRRAAVAAGNGRARPAAQGGRMLATGPCRSRAGGSHGHGRDSGQRYGNRLMRTSDGQAQGAAVGRRQDAADGAAGAGDLQVGGRLGGGGRRPPGEENAGQQ